MPPKLPRLPRPKLPPNPIRPLKELIHGGVDQIHKAQDDIRSLTGELRGKEAEGPTQLNSQQAGIMPTPSEVAPENGLGTSTIEGAVSEAMTFKYQLDRILDDLQHLETEHLAAKGRIAGFPCDCIAKAARDLRRHSLETIPIASRQGKDTNIFSEMVPLANELMEIGTAFAVKSGRYDDEYIRVAGIVSSYRKKIDQMLAECKECSEMENIATFIRERRSRQSSTIP